MSSPIDLEDTSPRTEGSARALPSELIVSHLQKRVCIELHTRGELGREHTEERQAGPGALTCPVVRTAQAMVAMQHAAAGAVLAWIYISD